MVLHRAAGALRELVQVTVLESQGGLWVKAAGKRHVAKGRMGLLGGSRSQSSCAKGKEWGHKLDLPPERRAGVLEDGVAELEDTAWDTGPGPAGVQGQSVSKGTPVASSKGQRRIGMTSGPNCSTPTECTGPAQEGRCAEKATPVSGGARTTGEETPLSRACFTL